MGGDHGPSVVIPAALAVARENPHLNLILCGAKPQIESCLSSCDSNLLQRIAIEHTESSIAPNERPSKVLRQKQDSSMALALKAVAESKADACVSAGDTGALMGLSKYILNTLPGIDRPAIIAEVPSKGKSVFMLDLGANVDANAESLFQFGVMGSVLCRYTKHIKKPTVGLLNIGSEEIKGNDRVKAAAHLLEANSKLNYIGYIEGNEIFEGKADVVVCDGFVGNSVLKGSEGIAKLLIDILKKEIKRSWWSQFVSRAALPLLKKLLKRFNPDQFNGATLIGLRGVVVKSHGAADLKATQYAIQRALIEAEQQVPERISDQLEFLLNQ